MALDEALDVLSKDWGIVVRMPHRFELEPGCHPDGRLGDRLVLGLDKSRKLESIELTGWVCSLQMRVGEDSFDLTAATELTRLEQVLNECSRHSTRREEDGYLLLLYPDLGLSIFRGSYGGTIRLGTLP